MGTEKQARLEADFQKFLRTQEGKTYTLRLELENAIPKLAAMLEWTPDSLQRLTLLRREDNYLAIINRDSGPTKEVLFSGGGDLAECLASLETAIRKGKWREDKPWDGPTD